MPQHGVTTMVTGNCAISLAPVTDRDRTALVDMFCYIEDLPVAPVAEAVPWTWSSWTEYRDTFNDGGGASCNIAPLVGHNNLRMTVLGEASFEREATDEERAALVNLLVGCVEAGAFGVSLSFVDSDSNGRLVPSRLAGPYERTDIAAALAQVGRGIVQYVPRFMRTEGYLKDVDKVDATCRPYGISHSFAPLHAQRRTPRDHRRRDGPGSGAPRRRRNGVAAVVTTSGPRFTGRVRRIRAVVRRHARLG